VQRNSFVSLFPGANIRARQHASMRRAMRARVVVAHREL
jgi:hypothetical protein